MFDIKNLKKLPLKHGVYIMKDINGRVIYVGKAKNLRSRVKQYFQCKDTRVTAHILTKQIETIETIVVSTNKEALLLENNLIKKYIPKYNILLKDDKTYVSLVLTKESKWPALKLIRLKKQPTDNNEYFGPYTNAKAAKSVLDLLLKLFPLRQCSDLELLNRTRPCILFEIKKCIAPCTNECTRQEYDKLVSNVLNFLKGKDKTVIQDLKKKMDIASEKLEYEKANEYLKLLKEIDHIIESQFVDTLKNKNTDVLGYFKEGTNLLIVKLIFINGRLTYSEHFSFSNILSSIENALESFILQNYLRQKSFPKEILIPINLPSKKNIEELLFETAGKKIKISYAIKGKNKKLLELANSNARIQFENEHTKKSLNEKQLLELKEILNLKNFPKKIICFDTSNIALTNPVAAMVTFIDGEFDKKSLKLFKIEKNAQDILALKEVLFRHFSKLKQENFPDLLVLDGGKSQLNAALEILNKLNIASIDMISLVKEDAKHTKGLTEEKIFLPYVKDPMSVDKRSPMLFLLQKIRDKAHEKAINFHKKRRDKSIIKTSISSIEGIGEKKTKMLLKKFKSIKNLKNAKKEELEKIQGLTKKDIDKILGF